MFFPEARIRVQVYGRPADLRQYFDGLIALTRHALREDPVSGQLFARVRRAPCEGGAFPVGANLTRRLSLQPLAIGAVMEVTKWLKPSV